MTTPETAVTAPETALRRGWNSLLAVAVISMLIGVAATTGVFLFAGSRERTVVHVYAVNIFLEVDATADQKAAIEKEIPVFKPRGRVNFVSKEEAWRNFQKMTKDNPDLSRESNKDHMPESFRFETKGKFFDCTGHAKVRHMPGVDEVRVYQHRVNGYVATITCDAEYANP